MLCALIESSRHRVIATDTDKTAAPFICPMCESEVIIKKGMVKIHHFAHKPDSDCVYGAGESEAHRLAKTEIYEILRASPKAKRVELERNLESVRPDVSGVIDGWHVAIEVQISSLSIETILHRTIEYAKKKIYVLWLPLWDAKLDKGGNRYVPRKWERWLHGLYYGHVYYWDGCRILDYEFKGTKLYVPESSWYEGDEEQWAGGYEYYSKRFRTPKRLGSYDLTVDFRPHCRKPWNNGFSYPAARIYYVPKFKEKR